MEQLVLKVSLQHGLKRKNKKLKVKFKSHFIYSEQHCTKFKSGKTIITRNVDQIKNMRYLMNTIES